jgi:hypothetical protein
MPHPAEPSVHIYTLSHLVNARVGGWERMIEDLERGRRSAYAYYQPVREAVVTYCARGGQRREEVVARMIQHARQQPRGRGQDPERDNLAAFEIFESACYPRVGQFVRSLLRQPQAGGVFFSGVWLTGAPHLHVKDKRGRDRYVFLRASLWNEDNLKAYMELLGVVVENTFGAGPENIWHMDLRSGRVTRHRPSKRVRANCVDAARHFARVLADRGPLRLRPSADQPTV